MEYRELTLMFTDIVGYSRLMGRDQAQTIAMLEDYRRILMEEIDKQQGTVIEFIGDAVFARFDSPLAGVTAAINIQKALFTFNHFRDKSLPRLQTRIGLHTAEVATKNGAVFGDGVNIAARLEPIAVADGVCVSDSLYRQVKDKIREPVMSLGVQPLKNINSKVRVYLIRPLGISLRIRGHYLNRRINEKLGAYRYAIAASVFLLIAAAVYFVPRWLVPGYDANYVEIADFRNLMNDGGQADYLSSGITEALRAQLADMRDVYVMKTGEGVEAPVILEGSVQKLGDNLRIAYQLIRRDGRVQIAGGKLDGAFKDIFILQDRVVGEIASYLAEEFKIQNFRPARIDMTGDVLAYDYYMRGLDYLNRPSSQSNSDEAIKFFTTALVHDASFAGANAGLCQAYRKKYLDAKESELISKAKDYCQKALDLDPALPAAIESMGSIYAELGQYEDSIRLLSGVLQLDEKNMQAALSLASVYGRLGELEKAESILDKIISLQPDNWKGYHMLGWLFLTNSQFDDAIAQYSKVLELTPKNSTALSNLGTAYFYIGELSKAATAFEQAAEVLPTGWAYSNTGNIYYSLGKYEAASRMYELAIELEPDSFEHYLNLGDTLRQLSGRENDAEKFYGKTVKFALQQYQVNASDPYVNYALSMAYLHLGEIAKSLNYLDQALVSMPNNPVLLLGKLKFEVMQGMEGDAFGTLEKLLQNGYSKKLITQDPDLGPFLTKPEAKQLLSSL